MRLKPHDSLVLKSEMRLRLKPHDQGRSQHGVRGQIAPPPDFSAGPLMGSAPITNHNRSLVETIASQYTIMPISHTNHIMQIS